MPAQAFNGGEGMGIKAYPEAAKGLYKVLLGQAFSAAAQLISIMVDATLGVWHPWRGWCSI